MAYTVVTETQAAAREYGKTILNALVACLEANAAVLKAGTRVVTAGTIYAGRRAEPTYPCIMVEGLSQSDDDYTMGGMGDSTRLLRLTYRVFGFDNLTGQSETGTISISQLADRIRAALIYNETLDGNARDLSIGRATFGSVPGTFLQGVQMDVTVEVSVVRP